VNRNKEPIRSEDQILLAARTVYQIVKLLKMTRSQFEDMYNHDVLSKIDYHGSLDGAVLAAHARGVRDVYLTILITEHCEFVYYHDGARLTVKELMQQGPGVREDCICGHQWLDSEFNFTEFTKEADPWI